MRGIPWLEKNWNQSQPRGQPGNAGQWASAGSSGAVDRDNPDLDAFMADSPAATPTAGQGDPRDNPDLDAAMGFGPAASAPTPAAKPAKPSANTASPDQLRRIDEGLAQRQAELDRRAGKPATGAVKTSPQSPVASPGPANRPQPTPGSPRPSPASNGPPVASPGKPTGQPRQPLPGRPAASPAGQPRTIHGAPVPPESIPDRSKWQPHQHTEELARGDAKRLQSLVQSGKGTPDQIREHHQVAIETLQEHHQLGNRAIDQMAAAKYGAGSQRAKAEARKAKQTFAAKIANVRSKLDSLAGPHAGKLGPPKLPQRGPQPAPGPQAPQPSGNTPPSPAPQGKPPKTHPAWNNPKLQQRLSNKLVRELKDHFGPDWKQADPKEIGAMIRHHLRRDPYRYAASTFHGDHGILGGFTVSNAEAGQAFLNKHAPPKNTPRPKVPSRAGRGTGHADIKAIIDRHREMTSQGRRGNPQRLGDRLLDSLKQLDWRDAEAVRRRYGIREGDSAARVGNRFMDFHKGDAKKPRRKSFDLALDGLAVTKAFEASGPRDIPWLTKAARDVDDQPRDSAGRWTVTLGEHHGRLMESAKEGRIPSSLTYPIAQAALALPDHEAEAALRHYGAPEYTGHPAFKPDAQRALRDHIVGEARRVAMANPPETHRPERRAEAEEYGRKVIAHPPVKAAGLALRAYDEAMAFPTPKERMAAYKGARAGVKEAVQAAFVPNISAAVDEIVSLDPKAKPEKIRAALESAVKRMARALAEQDSTAREAAKPEEKGGPGRPLPSLSAGDFHAALDTALDTFGTDKPGWREAVERHLLGTPMPEKLREADEAYGSVGYPSPAFYGLHSVKVEKGVAKGGPVRSIPWLAKSASVSAASWNSSAHPRGQPENAGEFAKKPGGGKKDKGDKEEGDDEAEDEEDDRPEWGGEIDQDEVEEQRGRDIIPRSGWDYWDGDEGPFENNVYLEEGLYTPGDDYSDGEEEVEVYRWVSISDGAGVTERGEWTADRNEARRDGLQFARDSHMEPPENDESPEVDIDDLPEEDDEEPPPPKKAAKKVVDKAAAKVAVHQTIDDAEADEMLVKLFPGSKDAREALALSVGAPEDAEVIITRVGDYQKLYGDDLPLTAQGVRVRIQHPALSEASRFVGIDDDGKRFVKNEILVVKPSERNSGIGSQIFAKQVDNAGEQGFDYISTHAAGGPGEKMNGYYTWPRFGYNESVRSIAKTNPKIAAKIHSEFPDAANIRQVMATAEGREWWKENGGDLFDARFDLAEGSWSRYILDEYMEEREKRGKA